MHGNDAMMDATTKFVIIGTALILGFDALQIYVRGTDASISAHMEKWSHRWPIIAFGWGFLMGHFYGN
jgi:hypothetical protein